MLPWCKADFKGTISSFQGKFVPLQITIQAHNNFVIVIYITNAVGYILQREVFRLKYDRAAGECFNKNRAM
jgi:hypothetical protein